MIACRNSASITLAASSKMSFWLCGIWLLKGLHKCGLLQSVVHSNQHLLCRARLISLKGEWGSISERV